MVNNGPPKRRNSEKKKEKSRNAARFRRSKESEIFNQLAQTLPLSKSVVGQLDKASIMRLVISCLKIVGVMEKPRCAIVKKDDDQKSMDPILLRALEGFLLVLSCDGDMIYMSENVNRYLGLTQIDLMGHSIFEFSHPCDHEEIKEMLTLKCSRQIACSVPHSRSFFFRMKCTLTTKGRNVNLKSASYKVIHCIGKMIDQTSSKTKGESKTDVNDHCLVAVGQPIVHPSNIEIPLGKQTFLTQHDLDMKFTYVDEKSCEILGYQSKDLLNKSVYQFHHLLDCPELAKSFKTLFSVGQCETGRYRFLAKRGGYAWVLTQATLIYVDKTQKPNCVVCINYFLSGVENEHEVISDHQLNAELERVAPKAVDDDVSSLESLGLSYNRNPETYQVPTFANRPSSCTTKIFAPLTEDMNKGFLMPSSDADGLTFMKDEPEDLTHLAPTPGGECVLLDSFGGFYDDVRLPENFFDVATVTDLLTTMKEDHLSTEKSIAFTRLENDPFLCHQDGERLLTDINSKDLSDTSSDLSSLKSVSPSELMLEEEMNSPESFPMVCHMANLELGGLASSALLSDQSLDGENEESISLGSIDDLSVITSTKDTTWEDMLKNGNAPMHVSKETSNLAKLLRSERHNVVTESKLLDSLLRRPDIKTNIKAKIEYPKGLKTLNEFDGNSCLDDLKRLNSIKSNKNSKCNSKDICRKSVNLMNGDLQPKRLSSGDLTCTKKAKVTNEDVSSYVPESSVLLNLLRSGKDDSNGYSCMNKSPYGKGEISNYGSPQSSEKSVTFNNQERFLDLKSENSFCKQRNSKVALGLLDAEMPSISALLSLTQHDMEVNAPLISSRNLLQGPELLLALDQSSNGFV